MEPKKVIITFQADEQTLDALKRIAKFNHATMSWVVRRFVEDGIAASIKEYRDKWQAEVPRLEANPMPNASDAQRTSRNDDIVVGRSLLQGTPEPEEKMPTLQEVVARLRSLEARERS